MSVFDVDGTLFDSRSAIAWSYAVAGVRYSDHVWGIPWTQWLPETVGSWEAAQQVHADKQRTYLDMIDAGQVSPLPAAEIFIELMADPHWSVSIASGASKEAVGRLLRTIGIDLNTVPHVTSADTQEKRNFLTRLTPEYSQLWYFDDDQTAGAQVCEATSVHLIQVTGKSVQELRNYLWMP